MVTTTGSSTSRTAVEEQPGMRMLRLYSLRDLAKCPLDKWGIPDPGEARREVEGEVMREDGGCAPRRHWVELTWRSHGRGSCAARLHPSPWSGPRRALQSCESKVVVLAWLRELKVLASWAEAKGTMTAFSPPTPLLAHVRYWVSHLSHRCPDHS